MTTVLVFVEQRDGKVSNASLPAITAAREVAKLHGGATLVAALGGVGASAAAGTLGGTGFIKCIVSEQSELKEMIARPYAEFIMAAAKHVGAEVLLGAASSAGKDLLPVVAALHDAPMASDILSVNADGSYVRPMYAGNVLAEVVLAPGKQVLSVRPTAFAPAVLSADAAAPIESISVTFSGQKVVFKSFQGSGGTRPDLGDAKVVVSGGRGTLNKEGFEKYIFPLADALNAAVGASRAAVDAGFAPNDWQVGQTGRVVAPMLYFAIGISGAIQHIAGMKDSKVIVAINKDPEAPIFEVADYGLVGDLTTLVPELISQLKK